MATAGLRDSLYGIDDGLAAVEVDRTTVHVELAALLGPARRALFAPGPRAPHRVCDTTFAEDTSQLRTEALAQARVGFVLRQWVDIHDARPFP
ncbi:hypothetical protein [Streptomyces mirabilis]